jgi:hypothetical protein
LLLAREIKKHLAAARAARNCRLDLNYQRPAAGGLLAGWLARCVLELHGPYLRYA